MNNEQYLLKRLYETQKCADENETRINTLETVVTKLQDDLAEAYRRIDHNTQDHTTNTRTIHNLQDELTATIQYIEDLEQWINKNTTRQ